ncbi:replication protein O [Caballeronia sp. SEWSISQ10-4 2]|uniref:replication protein O n=1 Tax=Caballeronia sp. SEWSISQ10-4 2 TaxID=2937438 RepID=UPI00264C10A6|nr:replication protein O [Caballeronia sp. SEWSISQ10-4 2]MDN7183908.1 replication protein O [Caballeronia sp. SEWSISQ10-4 2]
MLIAQLSVAGEGNLYPLPHPDDSVDIDSISTDQTALDEFLAGQSNLPWVVFRAAHRAANFPTLPARARAVLAALARTVDANRPYAAIFARRELLTDRAMQSMRTFYRSLDDLEAAGLIERVPQKRFGTAGLFGRAYLHLTEKSAIVLGYIVPSSAQQPSGPQPDEILSSNVENAERVNEPDHSFSSPCVTVADGAIYKDLFPKNQKRQPGELPADLQRLLNLGFRQFLIFKLMREAKAHAKLLSDVVEATWEHLRNAKRPISYLRALLRSPVDFRHQIRAKRLATEQLAEEKARAASIDAAVLQCAGHTFIDSANTRLITVSSGADSITVHHCQEARPRVATGQWAAAFVAALNAREVVPATSGQLRDFQLKCDSNRHTVQSMTTVTPEHAMPRTRTSTINDRLSEMKKMLRATCAGVSLENRQDRCAEGSGVAYR